MEKKINSLREIAEVLYLKYCFNIIGFKDFSKSPIGKWQAFQNEKQTSKEALTHLWGKLTGLGIVLGPATNVHAFDIDFAKSVEEAIKLLNLLGLPNDYPWLIQSGSGSGYHIYFRSEGLLPHFNERKVLVIKSPLIDCKQIELRISGLIVAPGSTHKSGKKYQFINENNFDKPLTTIDAFKIQEVVDLLLPPTVETNSENNAEEKSEKSTSTPSPVDSTSRKQVIECLKQLKEKGIKLSHDYEKWSKGGFAIANSFGEKGRDLFHFYSALSVKYNKEECDKAYTNYINAQSQKRTNKITLGTFFYECKKAGVVPNRLKEKLKLDNDNQFSTAVKVILNRCKIYRDAFTDIVYVNDQPLNDKVINSLLIYITTTYGFTKINKDFIQSVLESEYVEVRHRIKDLIEPYQPQTPTGNIQKISDSIVTDSGGGITIAWRGVQRSLKDVLIELYFVKMMRQFFEPVANDFCLILLGDMHVGKTYWLLNVLPSAISDLCKITQFTNDKDFKMLLAESALLVIDEIREKDMSSNEFMKVTMTTAEFPLRVPYGRKPALRRRIASLAGTGNNRFILRDPTGNRRHICFYISEIQKDLFNSVNKMDFFWEIFQLYKSGYDTSLTPELLDGIVRLSKDFEIKTEAEDLLRTHCPPADPRGEWTNLLSVNEIQTIINIVTKRFINYTQLGMAITRLGYEGKTENVISYNGKLSKVWKYYCNPNMDSLDKDNKNEFNDLPPLPPNLKLPPLHPQDQRTIKL